MVKKRLTYEGKTGSQVKKEIEGRTKDWDVTVNIEGGTGQESQYVIEVNIYDKKKKTADYFREGKKYSITITTEPIPTLAPAPAQTPTPAQTPAQTPTQMPVPNAPVDSHNMPLDSDGREAK